MTLIALAALLVAQAAQAPSPAPLDPATLGPALGQAIPRFEARDQHGRLRDLESLRGPKGLVLVFFRSADW